MTSPAILGVGDNVVDRYVNAGLMYPGGNAVNVAVLSRRRGARSAYVGRVGSDAAGELVLGSLIEEGVGTTRVQIYDGRNAYADVELRDRDRVFLRSSKEDSLFRMSADDLAYASEFDIAHTAYTANLAEDIPALATRTRVSYDFGTKPVDDLTHVLPHLFLGTISGGQMSAAEAEERACWLVARGATYGLVTRGIQGAVLASAGDSWHGTSKPVHAVDTLGAGDSFIASLLVDLCAGVDEQAALATAADHAAAVCTYHGAFGHAASIPTEASERALT